VDPKENRITIEREKGTRQTHDPRRLSGVSVHREVKHEFSKGDRIQFTAPSKELKVANRELGTIERVSSKGDLSIRLDSGREVRFNIREHAHLDHGYAVTATAARDRPRSGC
jgi:ATP-dependent exoDNAse (exonuclease V) alpha subunit